MKVLSLFSGVGGFDLGLEAAGMETVFQCEWDKHATNILEKHWPDVPRWGDISTLTGKHILAHAPVIDVVAWGSPCQDLSVAGKRAGLEGSRSGLFHEGVRIIKELRKETNNEYPRISIWENVYGALNSNRGADFGVILNEMAEAGALVQEWRVLDAQYFGVPQRRRRVFLISIFDTATATRCPDPLLPLCEGVQWHPATSHTTREAVTSETPASLGSGSQWSAGANEQGVLKQSISSKWSKGSSGPSGDECINMVVGSLAARDYKGVGNQYVNEGKVIVEPFTKSKRPQTATDDETWVANQPNPTLNAFDQGDTRTTTVIVQDPILLTMREGKPGGGKGPLLSTDKSLSLSTSNEQLLFQPTEDPIVFENSYRDAARIAEDGITQTLTSKMGTGGGNTPMVAFGLQGNMIGRQDHNGPQGAGISHPDDPMFSLTSTDRHAVVQYDGYNQRLYEDDVSVTIRIGRDSSDFIAQPIDISVVAPSLTASNDPSRSPQSAEITQQVTAIHQATMAVRRLTPLECERLMGWPDNWTATKADGTPQSDTHRYKQCGNGVASPVAQWIAQQLIKLNTP
jgi:DNA (cytosine-5)-methyltransferase 1